MPVSRNVTRAESPSVLTEIVIRPPSEVYLIALSKRFAKTWRMRMRSTGASHGPAKSVVREIFFSSVTYS